MQSGSRESLNENFWEEDLDSIETINNDQNINVEDLEVESELQKEYEEEVENEIQKEYEEEEVLSSLPEADMFDEEDNGENLFYSNLSNTMVNDEEMCNTKDIDGLDTEECLDGSQNIDNYEEDIKDLDTKECLDEIQNNGNYEEDRVGDIKDYENSGKSDILKDNDINVNDHVDNEKEIEHNKEENDSNSHFLMNNKDIVYNSENNEIVEREIAEKLKNDNIEQCMEDEIAKDIFVEESIEDEKVYNENLIKIDKKEYDKIFEEKYTEIEAVIQNDYNEQITIPLKEEKCNDIKYITDTLEETNEINHDNNEIEEIDFEFDDDEEELSIFSSLSTDISEKTGNIQTNIETREEIIDEDNLDKTEQVVDIINKNENELSAEVEINEEYEYQPGPESNSYIDIEQEIKELSIKMKESDEPDDLPDNESNELPESFFENNENFFDLLKTNEFNIKECITDKNEDDGILETPVKQNKIRKNEQVQTSKKEKIQENTTLEEQINDAPLNYTHTNTDTINTITSINTEIKTEDKQKNVIEEKPKKIQTRKIYRHPTKSVTQKTTETITETKISCDSKTNEDRDKIGVNSSPIDIKKKETVISLNKPKTVYKPILKKREITKTPFKRTIEKEPETKKLYFFGKGLHDSDKIKENMKPKVSSRIVFINGKLLEFKPTIQKRYDINKKEEKEKRIYVTNIYKIKINKEENPFINRNIKELLEAKESICKKDFEFLLQNNILNTDNHIDNTTVNDIMKIYFTDKQLAIKQAVDKNYWSIAFLLSGNESYNNTIKLYIEKLLKDECKIFFDKEYKISQDKNQIIKIHDILKYAYKNEYEYILDELLKNNKDILLQYEILVFYYKFYNVNKFNEYLHIFRFNFTIVKLTIQYFKNLNILPLKKNYYNFLKEFGTKDEIDKFYSENKSELKEKKSWNIQGWKGLVEKGFMKMVGLEDEEYKYDETPSEINNKALISESTEEQVIEKVNKLNIKESKEVKSRKLYQNKQYSQSYADIFSAETVQEEFKDDTDIFINSYEKEKKEVKKEEQKSSSLFNIFNFFKSKKEKKVKIEVKEAEYVYDKITKKWIDKNEKTESKPKENVEKIKKALPTIGDKKTQATIKKDGSLSSRYAFKSTNKEKNINNLIPQMKKQ
ncbi:hypothetical protein SLOPH_839 [Spraguea lophii 42_110]|uniref:Uncharacterized protein n=1 Tax=Spraguea lophii (strain 42_110) TaxID=1358809 RepID=S7W8Q1_SPRLO|nr:hypothetical protein SLOPH_839 [Spraguea lophii 42_110]